MSTYKFYQCENPLCRLRFPGYDGAPWWYICPACRSKISVVESVISLSALNDERKRLKRVNINAMLDNIRSALNVGSIFRTSDGVGINKIYLCGITPTPENIKVRKTSLGTENAVLWEKFNNGFETASRLKHTGYKLWALEDTPDAFPLFQVDISNSMDSVVLVVGNEVTGIDPGILKLCDKVISIPMLGTKSSYNVAVAFGIATSYLLYRLWGKESAIDNLI